MPVLKNQRHELFAQTLAAGMRVTAAADHSGIDLPLAPKYPKGFYVYLLVDPRDEVVFYVGKGMGTRCHSHLQNHRSKKPDNREKQQKIAAIVADGLKPSVFLVESGLPEKSAYDLEDYLIRQIGYKRLTNKMRSIPAYRTLLGRVFDNIARLRGFNEWLRLEPRTEFDIKIYWMVRNGLVEVARQLLDERKQKESANARP